jgi:hypothetical protein
MYSSGTMKYALAALVNLLTLVVGITIGVLLAPHMEKHVQAVGVDPQSPSSTQLTGPNNVEKITPGITTGTLGAYLVLAHHVQSDELVVSGLDLVKLEQGELNLLASIPGVLPGSVQRIVEDARNTHLYQVAGPPQPQPAQPAKPPAK